jgi:hypothetical protein
MSGKSITKDSKVANHETALLVEKGARSDMTDEHVCRANVAKSHFVRREAKVDVLIIAARICFRESANSCYASARDIEAEADASR